MYKDVFSRIIESSRTHSLTFFVGAGVSALSNAPKWSDLLDDICKEIKIDPKGKYSSDECLRIPQIYYCSINNDNKKYYTFIQSLFDKNKLLPNEIHKKVFDFNPASIITTNFDQLLESAATEYCKCYRVIACDNEIPNINGNKFILKLHGDFAHRNIVFNVIQYQKLLDSKLAQYNYLERYKIVLDSINNASQLNVKGKDELELFNILYKLIKPLNKFNSLRTQDLQNYLYPYVIVEEDGTMLVALNKEDILTYYFEISEMGTQEKKQLPQDILQQYNYITSVFSKSRIRQFKTDRGVFKKIQGVSYKFADTKCISFDFQAMRKITEKNSNSLQFKFQKAYYLAKLNLREEAMKLFLYIAKESYRTEDYYIYYLSQVNRNNLIMAMKSINRSIVYWDYYNLNGIEKDEKVRYLMSSQLIFR